MSDILLQVQEGLLKIKDGDKVTVATVFDVDSFTLYEEKDATEQNFLPFPLERDRLVFVELLYEGELYSILGKPFLYLKGQIDADPTRPAPLKEDYQRYLVDMQSGEIHELSRSSLLEVMSDKKKELKKFIRANRLRLKNTEDLIQVVKKYQELTS